MIGLFSSSSVTTVSSGAQIWLPAAGVTANSGCLDASDLENDVQMESTLETLLGDVTGITVTRTPTTGNGYDYRITFADSADVATNVAQIAAVAGGSGAAAACTAIVTDTGAATDVTSWTEMEGDALTPGVAYFVRISAINSAGQGEPTVTARTASCCASPHPTAVAQGCTDYPSWCKDTYSSNRPRAPPLAPTDLKVHSVQDNAGHLDVWWNAPTTDNGDPILQYKISWYELDVNGNVPSDATAFDLEAIADVTIATDGSEETMIGAASFTYRHTIDHTVNAGKDYLVKVTAINDQGDNSLSVADATPICVPEVGAFGEDCVVTAKIGRAHV